MAFQGLTGAAESKRMMMGGQAPPALATRFEPIKGPFFAEARRVGQTHYKAAGGSAQKYFVHTDGAS